MPLPSSSGRIANNEPDHNLFLRGRGRSTRLTNDEQYTHACFVAALLRAGNLLLKLIWNPKVIASRGAT